MKNDESPQQQTPEQNLDQSTSQSGPDELDLTYPKARIRIGLIVTIFGYLLFLLGVRPSLFNLDRSHVIGFVQISVFLVGLGVIIIGGHLTLNSLWPGGRKTIAADIGSRVISTGYVICVFTSMADIFGLGSHHLPDVFFGPLQAQGMMIGMTTIAIGFLLLIRYKRPELKKKSQKEEESKTQTETEEQKSPDISKFESTPV